MSNEDRAQRGQLVLGYLEDLYGNRDTKDNLLDALTDILHTGAINRWDLEGLDRVAADNYDDEVKNEPA